MRVFEVVDFLDRKILALLQADGDLSINDVANKVGLSSTPCWRRIQRLENEGYFKRRVVLDEEKLNVGVSVFIAIRTNQHTKQWAEEFYRAVVTFPEVVDLFRLSGEIDYLLRVVVPDIKSYDAFYQRLIERIDLYDVSSMFAMERLKSTTELPLEYMLK
jgi:Lrp/AsnC family transcriptional regulator